MGGFIIDPFRIWPPKMRQHAETLTAHGYRVKVREHFDGEVLEGGEHQPGPGDRAVLAGAAVQLIEVGGLTVGPPGDRGPHEAATMRTFSP